MKREKRKKVRDWEREYWEGIQESTQNAYQRNDQAELFKLSWELQLRPREGKRDVWKNSVEDVEKGRVEGAFLRGLKGRRGSERQSLGCNSTLDRAVYLVGGGAGQHRVEQGAWEDEGGHGSR